MSVFFNVFSLKSSSSLSHLLLFYFPILSNAKKEKKRNIVLLYICRPLKNPNQSTTSSKPLPSESSDMLAGLTNQGQLFGLSCKTERGENASSTPPRGENKAISVNRGRGGDSLVLLAGGTRL